MAGLILPYKGVMPRIHPSVFIADGAVVIGDVEIGKDSAVWFNCVIRGDVHEIRIGEQPNIQDGTIIHVTRNRFGTYIGSGITIGHHAVLHACRLEDDCFIGMGSTILDGAVVESRAMLAAGAVLTPGKRIASGELWAGNPARKMRDLTEQDTDFFPVSAQNYVELAKDYLDAQR
jgi:carbonic anhydrase/acetyltransferase-like protein (isoleucine patch superfamily)